MSFRLRRVVPAAFLAATVFVVTTAASPVGDSPPEVVVTAHDFSFDAPDRMPAGAVTIRFENQGQELHHAQLVRLEDGKTVDDLMAAEASGGDMSFATWVGGPGLVASGMGATVTLQLEPGRYAWLCFVETSDTPHLAMGMTQMVTVEGDAGEPLPEADRTMVLDDYSFTLDAPLTHGRQVIRVRNDAVQPHEVIMVKLAPGKTVEDILAFVAGDADGDPPGVPVGGMQALSQDHSGNMELYLDPGEYGLLCFIPDADDGQPHLVHGMVDQITVK